MDPVKTPVRSKSNNRGLGMIARLLLTLLVGFIGGWLAVQINGGGTTEISSKSGEKVVLQESELISGIAETVGPSVVSINVESSEASFFGSSFSQQSAGTGIILSSDGYIITNKHVIPESTTSVGVSLSDGTEYKDVGVVGRDPFTDIAFLKIDGASDLTAAKLGVSSDVKVGEKVVAIGNALGEFNNTVTSGIISGLSRPIIAGDGFSSGDSLQNLFQTDASINPGNSGGPLVNASGEVIGINTAVAGNAENIGFSIPVDDVIGSIETVLEEGELIKPYLGVRYVTLTKEIASNLSLNSEQGAYLDSSAQGGSAIVVDSPAAKAGLKEGDIITKVGDEVITSTNSLATLVGRFKVGETIKLTILREDVEQVVDVKLERVPETLQ